jgi:SAM-dependent methyltransferase
MLPLKKRSIYVTEIMEVFNQQYSHYYNLLYADKNYAVETNYIVSVLQKYAIEAKSVLEYGSGTGSHGVLLKKAGYEVHGVEQSGAMAKIAKERGLECEVANIITVDIQRKFDVCLALFHVISYINDNEQLVKLFLNTRNRLKPGGIFMFDAWFTPAVLYQVPETRVKKMADSDIEVTRIAVPNLDHEKNVVDVNYQIIVKEKRSHAFHEFSETHAMRHLGVPEVALLAEHTGFTLLRAEEFLTGNKPSNETWGVNFILQSK